MKCAMDISFSNPGKVTRFDISTGTSTHPFSSWNSTRLFNESARTPRGRVGMALGHPGVCVAAEGGRVETLPRERDTAWMSPRKHFSAWFSCHPLSIFMQVSYIAWQEPGGLRIHLWSGIHHQEEMEASWGCKSGWIQASPYYHRAPQQQVKLEVKFINKSSLVPSLGTKEQWP